MSQEKWSLKVHYRDCTTDFFCWPIWRPSASLLSNPCLRAISCTTARSWKATKKTQNGHGNPASWCHQANFIKLADLKRTQFLVNWKMLPYIYIYTYRSVKLFSNLHHFLYTCQSIAGVSLPTTVSMWPNILETSYHPSLSNQVTPLIVGGEVS